MQKEKKDSKCMKIVANINYIQDSFNKKSFNKKAFKERFKTLKTPYPEDFLPGLIKKNKIEKLGKDLFKFKDSRPIFHFITEEIYNEAATKHAAYTAAHKKQKAIKEIITVEELLEDLLEVTDEVQEPLIDMSRFLPIDPLTAAISFVKEKGFKVLKPVMTWEEV